MATRLLLQLLKLMIVRGQFSVVSSMLHGSWVSVLCLTWTFIFWRLLFGSCSQCYKSVL